MLPRAPFPIFALTLVLIILITATAANSAGLPGGWLTGVVCGPENEPLDNAYLELRDVRSGIVVASGYTHLNGSFELYNIPPGSYELVATSGLNEARERVQVRESTASVSLRMPRAEVSKRGDATVSVQQLMIPDKARKAVEKARKALDKNKHDEAEKKLAEALTAAPSYAEALMLRGMLRINSNQLDEARADLEKAIHSDPSYAMAHMVLGAAYNALSRFDDAVRVLDRALTLSPNAWQAYFEMSRALLGKGDFAEALRQVNKAQARMREDFAPLHLVKAHALLGLKNFSEAVSELELYLSQDPKGPSSATAREALDQARAFATRRGK